MSEVHTEPEVAAQSTASRGSLCREKRMPNPGGMSSLQSLATTIVIAVFVITFVVQAFQIPSESMEKTLLVGDYLLVDKAHDANPGIWGWLLPYRRINRQDIIVFRYPVNPAAALRKARRRLSLAITSAWSINTFTSTA